MYNPLFIKFLSPFLLKFRFSCAFQVFQFNFFPISSNFADFSASPINGMKLHTCLTYIFYEWKVLEVRCCFCSLSTDTDSHQQQN